MRMTEKERLFIGREKVEDKFTIILDYDDEIGVKENQSGDVVVLKHNDLNAQQFVAQLVVFLNDQNQAIVDLYDGCEYWSNKASERITLLEKENEQLKQDRNEMFIRERDAQNELRNIKKENEQLKQSNQEAIELIYDGIVEMHDGKRDYAETLFNKAIKVIKNDT